MKIFNWFKSSYTTIGKDLKWYDCIGAVYKVKDFDRADTITIKGQVIANSLTKPYGYIIVESYKLEVLRLPIIHQDDFLLASSVFDDKKFFSGMNEEQELLVTYYPKEYDSKGFSLSLSHVLHYVITPEGTKDEYYKELLLRPINIDGIFGCLTWDGELRVQVNLNPVFN